MTDKYLEKNTVISGIGQSEIGRRLPQSGLRLTLDAAQSAMQDAGLTAADIDGIATWPGVMEDSQPGFSPVSIPDIQNALGLNLNWYNAAGGRESTQMSALINACMAVASGQAKHVLCYRTMTEANAMASGVRSSVLGTASNRVSGEFQWQLPFQAFSAANWIGLVASAYFHEFGATREQLAQIPINARRNAALNPKAIYQEALSLDDYLSARMIASPLCLFDCDIPIDGSTAIIVSHRDTISDLKSIPIRIESICGPLIGKNTWDQQTDITRFCGEGAGDRMWARTDLKPSDVDFAQLYDGFSFLTLLWLEALGFCQRGEAASFVEGGHRIARDGELPINTHGGQLSSGRTHGFGFFHEAVLQLRGEAGERQLAGDPRVAAVSNGGGNIAGAALLVRE